MKIIPGTPISIENINEILGGKPTTSLTAYVQFLRKYGGGKVFPNSIKLVEPILLEGPLRAFSVQYFFPLAKIEKESAADVIKRDFDVPFIAIAVISGGDTLVLSLDPSDMGAIWFWSSFGDGVHGTKRRVANSFAELLETFTFIEEQGKTPPWNRMNSVDDAPAVDFLLDL
ncbi:SMI1/KNR4 family protein [Sulfitobacter pacificus]|nr:SMI1/KNR4 family protein [Sulfitobacter pacificus]